MPEQVAAIINDVLRINYPGVRVEIRRLGAEDNPGVVLDFFDRGRPVASHIITPPGDPLH
jgi:hypothetical protein